eukprot:TRINITY_DN70941_c0_g1_i1.p1 TRINITY_DN70941_c0_g1~~TRINITY_DN70941_c0_g1_i1.p1  ORF type:complete len:445 (+),score=203.16 TRINITY_DN70941_c0_g1_i1:86-1420(+)
MYGQQQQKQDPACARATELSTALKEGRKDAIPRLLDPAIIMEDITGRVTGPDACARALGLLSELLRPHITEGSFEEAKSDRDLKTARYVWGVHGLRFEDTITISSSLGITKLVRQKVASQPRRTPEQRAAAKRFLLAMMGSDGAAEKSPSGSQIDNRQTIFPVLDFSYRHLERPKDLLTTQPRAGRKHVDRRRAMQAKKDELQRIKEEEERKAAEAAAALEEEESQQIVIKGRSREGETAAYTFDRAEMRKHMTGQGNEQQDSDDDVDGDKERERTRWEASGVKLQGNSLTGTSRRKGDDRPSASVLSIEECLKRICVYAYYNLTWIDLSCNQLTVIPDFSQFPLVVLYLHANKIDDMKEVAKLKALEDLQSLTLFGNPIQDHVRNYKLAVLNCLYPRDGRTFSLRKFDFSVLSKDDAANMETLHEFTTVAAQNNKLRRKQIKV